MRTTLVFRAATTAIRHRPFSNSARSLFAQQALNVMLARGCAELDGAKVKSPIPDYLQVVVDHSSYDNPGHNASYISELRDADPNRVGACLSTVDGVVYAAGDTDVEFTIQSISKAFVYALALEQNGLEAVLERVGVEPSGEAFNELSLEQDTRRPLNPMINAGAITAHTLIGPAGISADERFELIRKGLSAFAGRDLGVDEAAFESEMNTAYRNTAIACMLRNYDLIDVEPEDVVKAYTRQCAISVTARDLALMATTLANGGVQPLTEERVVRPEVVRQVLSVMMTCGMYNGAGDWVSSVGIPAKSAVSGGIMAALPGQLGIATFSTRLDKHGTSVRGVRICKRLSDDMGLHIMHAPEPARSVVRRHYRLQAPDGSRTVSVLSLQGTITFTSAERVIRALSAGSALNSTSADGVVLDLRQVYSVDNVARRITRESVKRLRAAGYVVYVIDPEGLLRMVAQEKGPDTDGICDASVNDLSTFDSWKRLTTPPMMRRLTSDRALPRLADNFKMSLFS